MGPEVLKASHELVGLFKDRTILGSPRSQLDLGHAWALLRMQMGEVRFETGRFRFVIFDKFCPILVFNFNSKFSAWSWFWFRNILHSSDSKKKRSPLYDNNLSHLPHIGRPPLQRPPVVEMPSPPNSTTQGH